MGVCVLLISDLSKEGNHKVFSSEFAAASPTGVPLQRPSSLFSLLEDRAWAVLSL